MVAVGLKACFWRTGCLSSGLGAGGCRGCCEAEGIWGAGHRTLGEQWDQAGWEWGERWLECWWEGATKLNSSWDNGVFQLPILEYFHPVWEKHRRNLFGNRPFLEDGPSHLPVLDCTCNICSLLPALLASDRPPQSERALVIQTGPHSPNRLWSFRQAPTV